MSVDSKGSSPPAELDRSPGKTGGHLRVQYESPTGTFETSLEDGEGRDNLQDTAARPGTDLAASSEDGPSRASCVVASCSFYDHALHVWLWDRARDNLESQQSESESNTAGLAAV